VVAVRSQNFPKASCHANKTSFDIAGATAHGVEGVALAAAAPLRD
jgi:hypothetical protein